MSGYTVSSLKAVHHPYILFVFLLSLAFSAYSPGKAYLGSKALSKLRFWCSASFHFAYRLLYSVLSSFQNFTKKLVFLPQSFLCAGVCFGDCMLSNHVKLALNSLDISSSLCARSAASIGDHGLPILSVVNSPDELIVGRFFSCYIIIQTICVLCALSSTYKKNITK